MKAPYFLVEMTRFELATTRPPGAKLYSLIYMILNQLYFYALKFARILQRFCCYECCFRQFKYCLTMRG